MIQFGKGKTLLQLIDRKKFNALCESWGMDKGTRKLSTWEQTCTHIMAFVLRLESLREIEAALFVARSTFGDANSKRSAGFFQELSKEVLTQIQSTTRNRKVKKAIKELLAIDASECKVHGSLSDSPPWRQKNSKDKKMASIKFHAVWNINKEWIEDFRITEGNITDAPVARQFTIRPGCIYVFDRAYFDLTFWWGIVSNGSHFVSRLKTCLNRDKLREDVLRKAKGKDGVLWQGKWKPRHGWRGRHARHIPRNINFRYIIYRDPITKKVFDFITSDTKSSAQTIADIYKKRWAVELLFRWLKGHLNCRYFAAKNRNAIKIQMAIAVLVQLLIQLHRIENKEKGTQWDSLRKQRMTFVLKGLAGSNFPKSLGWNPLARACLRESPNVI